MQAMLIEESRGLTTAMRPFEIVERKGLGHPDSICDAVADRVSVALCRAYLHATGRILHHNCDKALLAAGQVQHRLGGGRVIDPMHLVIGGQATSYLHNGQLPLHDLVDSVTRAWFREHLPRVDADKHLDVSVAMRPGAASLTRIFRSDETVLDANDTSAAVGHAPMTETERLVLELERYINHPELKALFPCCGEDVKVMALRRERRLDVTVAVPLVDRHLESSDAYFGTKRALGETLQRFLEDRCRELDPHLVINALDRENIGIEGMYLSVVGTSAEEGDSGQVGRGNAVNGVIAACRPRGVEAAAGKNPRSHVGKIYGVLSQRLAEAIHHEVEAITEVSVWLMSTIGAPIDRPRLAGVRAHLAPGASVTDITLPCREILNRELARIPDLVTALARGAHPIC